MEIKVCPIYIVVEDDLLYNLSMKVNDKLKEGYRPQGGIAVCCSNNNSCGAPPRKYYQAMTKGLK